MPGIAGGCTAKTEMNLEIGVLLFNLFQLLLKRIIFGVGHAIKKPYLPLGIVVDERF